jgi:hypothetical protein
MLVKDRHALIRSEEFQKAADYGKITESPQMLLLSTCLCFFCLRVLQEAHKISGLQDFEETHEGPLLKSIVLQRTMFHYTNSIKKNPVIP